MAEEEEFPVGNWLEGVRDNICLVDRHSFSPEEEMEWREYIAAASNETEREKRKVLFEHLCVLYGLQEQPVGQ